MHHFEKMSSASRGFTLRPSPGSCPWPLLGNFRPSNPLIVHPWKKSCGRPWTDVERKTCGLSTGDLLSDAVIICRFMFVLLQLRETAKKVPNSFAQNTSSVISFLYDSPSLYCMIMIVIIIIIIIINEYYLGAVKSKNC